MMDAISYFFLNSGILLFVLSLLAFLLGLLLGWFIWGHFEKIYLEQQQVYQKNKTNLASYQKKLERCQKKNKHLQKNLDVAGTGTQKEIDRLQKQLDVQKKSATHYQKKANKKKNNLQKKLDVQKKADSAYQQKLESTQLEIDNLKQQLDDQNKSVAHHQKMATQEKNNLQKQLDEQKKTGSSRYELKLKNAQYEIDYLKRQLDNQNKTTDQPTMLFDNDNSISSDIPIGAKYDEKLGIIYASAPEETDDLTKISGVAKVLNKKLNDFGIYTYSQIIKWDQDVINEFSDRLSFKGRIERDDWQGQVKKLHKEKYNEDA